MDLLDRLLGHDHWTTVRFLELSRGLTDAQLDQPFDLGHWTVRATFEHMSGCVEFWMGSMAGQPLDAQPDSRSLAALLDRHERSYGNFAAFARQIRDEQRLDDTFPDPDDDATRLTFGSTIIHVILHNAQHRSEALHMFERLGVPGLREGNPLEWELAPRGL
jgi:uncharacterized damage-inducible protein DinB